MHFKRQLIIDGYRAILLLPALSALIGLVAFWPAGIATLGLPAFSLITLGAVLLSTFLLGYEMHQHPLSQPLSSVGHPPSSPGQFLPSARQFLPSARQSLSSARQSLSSAGQPLSPAGKNGGSSFMGLNSFTGNLIALLLAGLTDPKNLLILSWLDVLVVPYVLFAVWYQRRPVRQWSIGCLGLPVVLAAAPLTSPDAPVTLKIIVLFTLPLLAARLQWKTYRKNLENQSPLL